MPNIPFVPTLHKAFTIDRKNVLIDPVVSAPLFAMPNITFPSFTGSLVVTAIVSITMMAITHNYSGPAILAAGMISILLGFVGKLAALIGTVPLAVSGGLIQHR